MSGFTKLFSSIVTSTIWCEDNATLRVWIAMLSLSDAYGVVEGSIPGFASMCRITRDEMVHAIDILSSPDKYSRTPDHEGRRVVMVDGGWKILNYSKFREKRQNQDGSRAFDMRTHRERKRNALHNDVTHYPEAEAEAYTEAEEDKEKKQKRVRFDAPTAEQISLFCSESGITIDVQRFHDYYTANGWRVGRNPMKDWKATVRNWNRNDKNTGGFSGSKKRETVENDKQSSKAISEIDTAAPLLDLRKTDDLRR